MSSCSLVAALIGGFVNRLQAKHGIILFVTFAVAGLFLSLFSFKISHFTQLYPKGIIQYYYNAGVGLASFELIEEANIRINNFGAQGVYVGH